MQCLYIAQTHTHDRDVHSMGNAEWNVHSCENQPVGPRMLPDARATKKHTQRISIFDVRTHL